MFKVTKQENRSLYVIIETSIFIFLIIVCSNSFALQNSKITIIGKIIIHNVKEEETLYDIARDYKVGIEELIYTNLGVDTWLPNIGAPIIIPTMYILPHAKCEGIVINKADLRLYYFTNNAKDCNPKNILSFPISIGGNQHKTPVGTTYITKKKKYPNWIPPISIRLENPNIPNIIPPGEDNPLGNYAIYLGWPEILIHGTNKPWGIGRHNTHGCISMYPEDIKILFERVKIGTIVQVVDQPVKTAYLNCKLYIEISPNQEQKSQLDTFGKVKVSSAIYKIKTEIINEHKNVNKVDLDTIFQNFQSIPRKLN